MEISKIGKKAPESEESAFRGVIKTRCPHCDSKLKITERDVQTTSQVTEKRFLLFRLLWIDPVITLKYEKFIACAVCGKKIVSWKKNCTINKEVAKKFMMRETKRNYDKEFSKYMTDSFFENK